MLRAALGNPAGRRVENTAEPVLCPAALTLPRGHRPLPQGGGWQWGQTPGISVPLLRCSRLATERNAGPCCRPHIPEMGLGGFLTGFCSLGCRGVVLPLEPRDAGLSRRDGAGRWPGLPGSEGGSWGENSSVRSRNPSVHDRDIEEPPRSTVSSLGIRSEGSVLLPWMRNSLDFSL